MVEAKRKRFRAKWQKLCTGLITSFDEVGDQLLFTFLAFPCLQWCALRTSNVLERIDEEFRCRIRTQASLPKEIAVLLLLFALLRSGRIRPRKLYGYEELTER